MVSLVKALRFLQQMAAMGEVFKEIQNQMMNSPTSIMTSDVALISKKYKSEGDYIDIYRLILPHV
jgi:hypothetical protein